MGCLARQVLRWNLGVTLHRNNPPPAVEGVTAHAVTGPAPGPSPPHLRPALTCLIWELFPQAHVEGSPPIPPPAPAPPPPAWRWGGLGLALLGRLTRGSSPSTLRAHFLCLGSSSSAGRWCNRGAKMASTTSLSTRGSSSQRSRTAAWHCSVTSPVVGDNLVGESVALCR